MDRHGDEQRRTLAQRRSHARTTPARVLVPFVLATGAQVLLIGASLATGLATVAIICLCLCLAVVSTLIHRRTVGSLVAGAGLRVAQPYVPGEQVRLFVPSLDSVEDAEVVRVGPANTTLLTAHGVVVVPNVRMLRGTPERPAA